MPCSQQNYARLRQDLHVCFDKHKSVTCTLQPLKRNTENQLQQYIIQVRSASGKYVQGGPLVERTCQIELPVVE